MVEPVDTASILRTLLKEETHKLCTGGPPAPTPPPTTPVRDVLRYHNAFHIDATRRQQCAVSAIQTGLLPYSEVWAGVTRRSKLSPASPIWPDVMQTHTLGKAGIRSFPAVFDMLRPMNGGDELDETCAIHATPMLDIFPPPIRIASFSEWPCAPLSASAKALCPTEADVRMAAAQTTKECGDRRWPPIVLEDDATAYAAAYCLSPNVAAAMADDHNLFQEHTKLCDAIQQLGISTLVQDGVADATSPTHRDMDRDDARRCLLHAAAARHAGHVVLAEALIECRARGREDPS